MTLQTHIGKKDIEQQNKRYTGDMPSKEPQYPPQTASQPPAPQQPILQPASVQKSSARWLVPAVIILAVLVVSGVAYAYKSGFTFQILPTATNTTSTTNTNSTNVASTTSVSNDPGVMALADYVTKTVQATDTLPNTMRIQVYGPSTFSGFDFNNNPSTKPGMLDCDKGTCAGSELRLDFVHEPMDPNKPLLSVSLASVQQEYNQWVADGRKGIFYSSVISVPLPTPPPRKGIDLDSYGEWIGVVYFDTNGNKVDDIEGDNEIFQTAFMQYYWDNNPPQTVLGWNISTRNDPTLSDPAAIAAYRKAFESTIVQIPAFNTLFPDLISEKLAPQMQQAIKSNLQPPPPIDVSKLAANAPKPVNLSLDLLLQPASHDGEFILAPTGAAYGIKGKEGYAIRYGGTNTIGWDASPDMGSYIWVDPKALQYYLPTDSPLFSDPQYAAQVTQECTHPVTASDTAIDQPMLQSSLQSFASKYGVAQSDVVPYVCTAGYVVIGVFHNAKGGPNNAFPSTITAPSTPYTFNDFLQTARGKNPNYPTYPLTQ